ncbi:hypothetical protein PHLH6_40250 [Pseudomonas sp. Seg1]|nr:hypothetical protein PHLH6_40250 [Pseudomonas sp. Seg1]
MDEAWGRFAVAEMAIKRFPGARAVQVRMEHTAPSQPALQIAHQRSPCAPAKEFRLNVAEHNVTTGLSHADTDRFVRQQGDTQVEARIGQPGTDEIGGLLTDPVADKLGSLR